MLRSRLWPGPVHAVDQKNVLPAVAVVIEEGAARAQSFRQQLAAVGAAVVAELQPGSGGHIDQPEAGSRRADAAKASSSKA